MKRILIIGGNGAGKTTFARELSKKIELPLVHLDSLYWTDHWNAVTNDEFDTLLFSELEKPTWILDGNMSRTIPLRLKHSDTVIYLDFPRVICMLGIIKRFISNLGVSRPDMGANCPERISLKFINTAWNFNSNNREKYYEFIASQPNNELIILKNRRQVKGFLDRM